MADQEAAHAAEELASNLASYERQLAEVEELLLEDPDNSELQAIFDNLTEVSLAATAPAVTSCNHGTYHSVLRKALSKQPQPAMAVVMACRAAEHRPFHCLQVIQLAQELCQTDAHAATEQLQQTEDHLGSPAQSVPAVEGRADAPLTAQASASATLSTLLPPQVAEQIRLAQQRAALAGQGPPAWAVGAKCRALYSGDGNW